MSMGRFGKALSIIPEVFSDREIEEALRSELFTCPIKNDNVTYETVKKRVSEGESNHPYDSMCIQACEKFPHCKKEIFAFFEFEKIRNEKEGAEHLVVRSEQWQQFWNGIRKLELDRHNEEVKKKKELKNERRRKAIQDPTYYQS